MELKRKPHEQDRGEQRDRPCPAYERAALSSAPEEEHDRAATGSEPASDIVQVHVDVLGNCSYASKTGDVDRSPPPRKAHAPHGGRDRPRREEHSGDEKVVAPRILDETHLRSSKCAQHLQRGVVPPAWIRRHCK